MVEALVAPDSRHNIHRRSRHHNHRHSRGYRAHFAGPGCHDYNGHRNHPGSHHRHSHYSDSRHHNRRSRHRTRRHIPRPGPEYIGWGRFAAWAAFVAAVGPPIGGPQVRGGVIAGFPVAAPVVAAAEWAFVADGTADHRPEA